MDCPTKPPRRQAVLVVADGDYIEVFGENVDVHVAKMPQAGTRQMEDLAERILHEALPLRYRTLFDRSKLRCNAIIRPLPAEVAYDALRLKRLFAALGHVQADQEGEAA